MESTLSAQEPGLIEALDFRLPQVANYVTSREEVVFVPSGNVFAPSGVRTLRIPISGGAFVDASSITVEATLTNLDSTNLLTPTTCSLAGFLEELRIFMSGVEVERIGGAGMSYGRLYEQLSRAKAKEVRENEASLELGFEANSTDTQGLSLTPGTFGPNQSIKVFHRPLAGICQQKNFIPLFALTSQGLVFEFLVQGNAVAPLSSQDGVLAAATSSSWQLSNIRLHADVLHVDSAMLNSYSSHLLAGRSLNISGRTYSTVVFSNNGSVDTLLQIPRTFTRVNQILVSFYKETGNIGQFQTEMNTFRAPGVDFESFVQIGSVKYPQNVYGQAPNGGLKEHYYRFLKGTGLLYSAAHAANTSFDAYGTRSFQLLFDLEKVPQSAHSGMSTHEATVTIHMKGMAASSAAAPTKIYVTIFHDYMAEISDGGVVVAL